MGDGGRARIPARDRRGGRRRNRATSTSGRPRRRTRRPRSSASSDLVIERLDAHPEMHVYHYGGYEAGAIKRLMQRHGTCVDEVDRLLRATSSSTCSTSSGRASARRSSRTRSSRSRSSTCPTREGPVTEAGFSVVAFETWLKNGTRRSSTGSLTTTATTASRRWLLRGWLEDRRAEAMARWPELDWDAPGRARSRNRRRRSTNWLQAVEDRVARPDRRPRAGRPVA